MRAYGLRSDECGIVETCKKFDALFVGKPDFPVAGITVQMGHGNNVDRFAF